MSNTRHLPKPKDDLLDLDVLQAEADFVSFPFRLDGELHELTHVRMLSTEQALLMESGGAATVMVEVAGEDLGGRLMKLPNHAMEALLERWLKHAGLKPGESPASTGS